MFRRTLLLAIAWLGCGPTGQVVPPTPDSGAMTVTDAGPTAPLLELGTGSQSFEPLTDGQGLTIIAGPQGGFHLWAAARVSPPMNPMLISFRVKVKLGANELSSTDYKVNAVKNGAYSEWYAMTALVPDPAEVRGKSTTIELTATDSTGRTATDSRTVVPSGP